MKIPKAFHAVLGIVLGWILFLIGIALLSCAFVAMVKAWQYAKPYAGVIVSNILNWLQTL